MCKFATPIFTRMYIRTSILQDFKDGRIEGFYAEVYPSLLLYAMRNLGADYAFLGEDCVQDSVFEAYHKREDFSTPEQFKSFLYKCVYNKIVSIRRKNRSRDNYLAQKDNSPYNLLHAILEQETLDLLHEAIDRLPPDLSLILELSYVKNMKNAEVASVLSISESAVKKKKARMLNLLRGMLGDEGNRILSLLVLIALASRA